MWLDRSEKSDRWQERDFCWDLGQSNFRPGWRQPYEYVKLHDTVIASLRAGCFCMPPMSLLGL